MAKKNIAGAIGSVMFIMIASRLLALLSSQIYMSAFGTDSIYINIYSYAVNIPNIIFTCIGTALSTVVVPLYVGHKALGEEEKAKQFANNIITIASVLTVAVIIISVCISPLLVNFTGFAKTPKGKDYATKALMMVMPVMLFYAWNYIFQGMLQAEGKYRLPAFVSVPSSLMVILYVLIFGDKYGVTGLLIATIAGLSLQAFILIPPLVKGGYRYRPCLKLKDPDIVKAAKMTVPVLIGVGSYQINMLFNSTMIARYDATMVTLITFVQNITIQLVVSISYSVTAVVYPKLSECVAKDDMNGYKETLGNVLKSVMVILIPITAGYISVREPLLNFLVGWGKVQADSVSKAEIFLSLYALGVVGIGLKEILDRAFYSLKNTWISAVNGFVIMGVNIILTLVLMHYMKAYGIPLAYSLASLVGIFNLMLILRIKIGSYAPGMIKEILKSVVCSLVMVGAVWLASKGLSMVISVDTLVTKIVELILPVISGIIVYAILGYVVGIEAIKLYGSKILGRFKER